MNYATIDDMQSRFGVQELISLTDPDLTSVVAARVELALSDAQACADSYIARVLRLPLVGCAKPTPTPADPYAVQRVVPPQLVRIVCDIARYYLYHEVSPEDEVYLRYKAAERELQSIAEGKAVLNCPWGGPPGAPVTGDTPGECEVLHKFSPRQVTDSTLRGFA